MSRALAALTLPCLIVAVTGCAMCDAPDDFTYAAYGGRVQREDMVHGRVGSILGPAGGMTMIPYEEQVPTNAVPPGAPQAAPPGGPPAPPNLPPAPPVLGDEESAAEGLEEVLHQHLPLQ